MEDFYKLIKDSKDIKKTYNKALGYLKDKFDIPNVTLYQVKSDFEQMISRFKQVISIGSYTLKVKPNFTISSSEVIDQILDKEYHVLQPAYIKHLNIVDYLNDESKVVCFPVSVDKELHFCTLIVGPKAYIDKILMELSSYMFFLRNSVENLSYKVKYESSEKENKQLQYGLSRTQQNLKEREAIINSFNSNASLGVAFLQNQHVYNFDKGFCNILQIDERYKPESLELKNLLVEYKKIRETIKSHLKQANSAFFECQFKTLKDKIIDIQAFITPSKLDDSIHIISIQDISKRKSAERLQDLIFTINKAVNTTSSLYEFTSMIKHALDGWIDTSNFYLALYHPEDDELSLPFFDDEKDVFDRVSARKTLTGNVIKSRQAIMLNKQEIEALLSLGEIELIGSIPEIWMGIPLVHQSTAIGMIGLQNYTPESSYTSEQFKLMQYLADQFSYLVMKKNQEISLREAIQRAMESDRLKTSFLSNISHEIRTPMNSILGFSELLYQEELTPEEKELYIGLIHQNGHDLMSLINDMIDIAKIEAGEIKLAKTDVSVINLLKDVQKANTSKAKESHIKVIIDPAQVTHDVFLFSDPFRLQQVMNNLVDNGIKYGLSKDVRIGFKLVDNDEFIELYVIDQGIGIAEDLQDIIFDPFRQANESHIKTTGGNGLGLSITRSLTQLLGGSIRLDSKEGYGSKFSIKIPIEKEKFIQSKKKYAQSFNWENKHILVAEDVLHNFQFLDMILKKSGAIVSWAKNGKEAVNMCKKECPYDLILMDIQMPIMDGLKATRIIKNYHPDVPIIAQTAYAQTTSREDVFEAGCSDYVYKPIKTNELLKKIAQFLTDESDND